MQNLYTIWEEIYRCQQVTGHSISSCLWLINFNTLVGLIGMLITTMALGAVMIHRLWHNNRRAVGSSNSENITVTLKKKIIGRQQFVAKMFEQANRQQQKLVNRAVGQVEEE